MKKSNTDGTLRGIVVAGNSRQDAEENYRAVATGVSVRALQDSEGTFTILSNADDDITLLNPLSGEMDLVEASSDLVGRMEFVASDSEEEIKTFYTLCSDGCNSHLIADDPDLMVKCPACASELKDLDEESIEDIVSTSSEDDDDDCSECSEDSIVVVASSYEEAVGAFSELASGMGEKHGISCESAVVVSNLDSDSFTYSPWTGESSSATELEDSTLTALSGSEETGNLDCHYYVCANKDDCGSHVISSSESPVFCPSCSSGLIEPDEAEAEAALSSNTDDTEEAHAGNLEEDFEEVLAGDDEDCSDEDEDDAEDSDDEDDSDEDDSDDEDSDDSDEDDINTLSVSNVTFEEDDAEDVLASADSHEDNVTEDQDDESVSSDNPEDTTSDEETSSVEASDEESDAEMVSVASSLMVIASKGEPLESSKLEVAYAGNIQNESTWLAFYEGMPVAKATSTSAAKHSDIFTSPVFGQAVLASATETGNVNEALSSMGFIHIMPEFSVESHVEREIAEQVESRVGDVAAKYESESADYNERFLAALSTAAQGINRNFFKGITNPIKVALAGTMQAAGIRNPEELISKAFADHSDTFHKSLINKASEIVAKTVDTQNELAEAVASANPSSVESSAVLSVGAPVKSVQVAETAQESVSSGGNNAFDNMDAILAGLGKSK